MTLFNILGTFMIGYVVFGLIILIFDIWMFIDMCLKKKLKHKIWWVLFFIFFSTITAIAYAITKKKWK